MPADKSIEGIGAPKAKAEAHGSVEAVCAAPGWTSDIDKADRLGHTCQIRGRAGVEGAVLLGGRAQGARRRGDEYRGIQAD